MPEDEAERTSSLPYCAVLSAIGWALVAAIQPVGIIAYTLILTRGGRRTAWGFVVGWLLSAVIVTLLTIAVERGVAQQSSSSSVSTTGWLQVGAGVLTLAFLLFRRVRRRSAAPAAAEAPASQEPVDTDSERNVGPVGAAVIGALTQGWPIVAAAVAAVLGATSAGAARVLGILLVILICTSTYLTAQIFASLNPERTQEWLQSLRRRLEENREITIDAVLLVAGVWFLLTGIVALASS